MQLTALDGSQLSMESLAGKVLVFVNVASLCGYTPQYAGLQALYTSLRHRGLLVIGVPCNQFGAQEPGAAQDIEAFCTLEYGVTFPMLAKQEVNGPGRSAVYDMLVHSEAGGGRDVRWNFEKFIVGRDGKVRARFGSDTAPDDAAFRSAIDAALSS